MSFTVVSQCNNFFFSFYVFMVKNSDAFNLEELNILLSVP